ncbi:MAG TPA: CopG family transcriptional regulator [Steroidobacteraceae bacterium]|nr:CopG family transcriptional regulator [Steroidobacteraceae bacterium]
MRTTLVLDDELFRRVKRQAAERDVTISDIVNDALRAALSRPASPAPPFSMTTYGRAAPRVQHEPADLAEALEQDDIARLRGA